MKLKARKVTNYDLYANHAWYLPGVKGMFALFGFFLLGSILGAIVIGILALFVPQAVLVKYEMVVTYPLSFLPVMIYAANKSQRNSLFETGYKLNSTHFGPFKWWQLALITVVLTFSYMFAFDYVNYLNFKVTTTAPLMKQFYDFMIKALEQMMEGPFWSSFLVTAIFAPIFEEWMCRGMVLRGLLTKMKPVWAIVLSALFFAIIHLNPWQALNAFIIGVIMGYIYYKTGSLWLTMLIHFVNNGTSVVLTQFTSLDENAYWIELMDRSTYVVVYVLGVAALAACIWAFKRIPLQQQRGNIDTVELKAD